MWPLNSPGRLDSLFVEQGDTVRTGQLLGVLRTNEIEAIRAQALAAVDAAKGQLELLQQGPRKELVSATGKLYEIAEDQYDLFSKTYDRMQRLYNADVISGQEKDIFFFKYQAAQKEMETAKLNLEMLQKGTRPELIKSAQAIVKQAEQAHELTKALKENTRIYSPPMALLLPGHSPGRDCVHWLSDHECGKRTLFYPAVQYPAGYGRRITTRRQSQGESAGL